MDIDAEGEEDTPVPEENEVPIPIKVEQSPVESQVGPSPRGRQSPRFTPYSG